MKAIERAVKAAGGQSALARVMKVSPQLVYFWQKKGQVPVKHVLAMEKLTGVSRYDLRPDVYPDYGPPGSDLWGDKDVPYQQIVALYHEILPELPRCLKLTTARKSQIRARFSGNDATDLDDWRKFFEVVKKSKFLTGQVNGEGHKPFRADLGWLIKEANFVKVLEGKYNNG